MNFTEITNDKTRKGNHAILAFILGLLSANNIIYAFVIGSTPILAICIYALFCLGWLILTDTTKVSKALYCIPNSLWMFIICVLVSVITIILFNHNYLYQWIVGLVDLLLYSSVIFLVIALKDNLSSITKGILVGILINAIVVVFAFICYKNGIIFTLRNFFPAWDMPIQTSYNIFRGWGLFSEPGHLMRYVAIMTLVVYSHLTQGSKLIKYVFIIAVAIIMTFTISSSIAVFVVGLIAFLLLSGKNNKRVINASVLISFAILVLIIFSKFSTFCAEILQYFMEGLFNFKETDSSSEIRRNGMQSALFVVKDYAFIGCGWNTFTKVFQASGFYIGEVKGSYSELLTLVAELGIGAITYLIFLFSNAKYNIKKRDLSNIAMGCAIMIYFALFTLTDYSLNGDCAVFIGLIIANRIQSKKNGQETQ